MNFPRLIVSLVIFWLLLPSVHAKEKVDVSALTATYTKSNYENNIKGWKKVYFLCDYDKKDKVLTQLCEKERVQARFIARSLRIPLEDSAGWEGVLGTDKASDYLVIVLDMVATASASGPEAVYAAINLCAVPSSFGTIKFEEKKLTGFIVMRSLPIIGATSDVKTALVHPIATALDDKIKQILTDFVDVNSK